MVLSYNQSRYLSECLDSVAAQTLPDVELLILDDASTDGSAAVAAAWLAAHPGLPATLIVNERNLGICANLNVGLRQARGRYIAQIAADDRWEPTKLADQSSLLDGLGSHVGIVYSDAYLMDEDGSSLGDTYFGRWYPDHARPSGSVFGLLARGNFLQPVTTMIRREVFETVGHYDESLFYEDWDMWLRACDQFEVAYSSSPSAWYRVSPTSAWRHPCHQRRILDSTAVMFEKWLGTKEGEELDAVAESHYSATRRLHAIDPFAAAPHYRELVDAVPSMRNRVSLWIARVGLSSVVVGRVLRLLHLIGLTWVGKRVTRSMRS